MEYITIFGKEDYNFSLYICENFSTKDNRALIKNCKHYINHNSSFGLSGKLNTNKNLTSETNYNSDVVKYDSEKKLKDYYFNNLINICWNGNKSGFLIEFFENYENEHIDLIGWLLL